MRLLLRRLVSKFRGLTQKRLLDSEMDEEMRTHLEMRIQANMKSGMSPKEARFAAMRGFGWTESIKETCRDQRSVTWLEHILHDIRFGLRQLRKSPGFAATAILSLALGIGANTAIFSILNAVLLRTLPVEDPQRLVQLTFGNSGQELTNPIWEQVRDNQTVFSGVLAFAQDRFNLTDGGESQYAKGLWVSGDFFRVLGVPPLLGRTFTPQDDQRGGAGGALAVISHGYWKRHFSSHPKVIGKTIRLNRNTFQIIGVTPPWFKGLNIDQGFDVAVTLGSEPFILHGGGRLDSRMVWWLQILGRLRPGQNMKQAEEMLAAVSPEMFRATLPAEFPQEAKAEYLKNKFTLQPAGKGFSATGTQYRTALVVLMVSVGLVLLIACANIANLLLARASARWKELSVRMAIGASRSRIVRQLLTESLILALLGGIGGLLFAQWGSRLLIRLFSAPGSLLEIDVSPDIRVLAFTSVSILFTAILFGLAPALRVTKRKMDPILKENARGSTGTSDGFKLGKALVAGQVALSLILLVGAGLFLGTIWKLLNLDTGFNRENLLLVDVHLPTSEIPESQWSAAHQVIFERILAHPGVESAARLDLTPISGAGWAQNASSEFFASKSRGDALIFLNRVSPGYFKTMRTPFIMGRDFNFQDDLNGPKVVIISESTARQFFGEANPIGRMLGVEGPGPKEDYEVIGVVKDSKYQSLKEGNRQLAYFVATQSTVAESNIRYVVRSLGDPSTLANSLRSVITATDNRVSLGFQNFETQVKNSLLQNRSLALLSTIFAALALLLAMVGLYGIASYEVVRRRGEIGIRMALGAQRDQVVRLVIQQGMFPVLVGILLGTAGALALIPLIRSLLFGVEPVDPLAFTAVALLLLLVALFACAIPARRASKIDPMEALRYE